MRKIFSKVLSGVVTTALAATLVLGGAEATTTKAAAVDVNWSFSQGGCYASEQETEWGNVGYLNSVSLTSGEVLSNWERGVYSEQRQDATKPANGFVMEIENTGWDCDWANSTINPWSIQAYGTYEAVAGHDYTVTFKAKASKKKFCYFTLGTNVEGINTPYDEAGLAEGSSDQIFSIGTTEKTFTYKFTNWTSVSQIKATFMLGAFDAQKDYAGNDISSIITEVENKWDGSVTISDFSVTDEGKNPDFVEDPSVIIPTQPSGGNDAPTVKPNNGGSVNTPVVTPAAKVLGQVKNVKATSKKKGTVVIKWAKVANAKSYQVKVGKKKYTAKKNKLTVKKLKSGKKVKITVKALKNGAYAAGKASKAVKVKVK